MYSRIAAHNSQDYSAIVQLGRIALLSNRLTDAQQWLQKAIALQPGDTDAKVMLAEAFHRVDQFEKAAEAPEIRRSPSTPISPGRWAHNFSGRRKVPFPVDPVLAAAGEAEFRFSVSAL